jgi:hypothetical protein
MPEYRYCDYCGRVMHTNHYCKNREGVTDE